MLSLPRDERRALGLYLTPPPLAWLMARLLRPHLLRCSHPRVLDPAAGTGRLLDAVAAVLPPAALAGASLLGVEKDSAVAAHASATSAAVRGRAARLVIADALELLDPARRAEVLGAAHFEAVIANPPYVREKDHRGVFAEAVRRTPDWAPYCAPRSDLQQLFLALGAELLAEGGEMVFLVNPYWLHADSGRRLRDYLRERVALLALVDFGERRLFDDAPGQHGLLVHARRKPESTDPAPLPAPTRFVRVTREAPADLAALAELLEETLGAESPRPMPGLALAQAPGPVVSGSRGRWYYPSEGDAQLAALEATTVPLGELFATHQGVVSGADVVTRRNARYLAAPPPLGTGIFLLNGAELEALGLDAHERRLLRPVYRGRDVAPFDVDTREPAWVLYLHDGVVLDDCPRIARHLGRFRTLLERRRECRAGKMPWWRLHWPRDPALFTRPRLVTPRRATSPRFALAPPGFCEQSDLALVTDPADDARRLSALLVALNSGVVAAWCRLRGKHKGAIREFFGRPLEELPLPLAARDDPVAFCALADYRDRGAAELAVRSLYGQPRPVGLRPSE
jgi:adenine-specific DNA-methyltransferase